MWGWQVFVKPETDDKRINPFAFPRYQSDNDKVFALQEMWKGLEMIGRRTAREQLETKKQANSMGQFEQMATSALVD